MNTEKNTYTLLYAIVLVTVVALLLAFVSIGLKERQSQNIALDKKKQILSSLRVVKEGMDIGRIYDKLVVKEYVINSKNNILSDKKGDAFTVDLVKEQTKPLENRNLPVYEVLLNGETKYIIPVRGTGLWGSIWGYVSLERDRNTIYGVYFSHASETPGLGAEISNQDFQSAFIGKRILDVEGEFVSVAVLKSSEKAIGKDHVDGISGGTITSKGVEKMMYNSLKQYDVFFKHSLLEGGSK